MGRWKLNRRGDEVMEAEGDSVGLTIAKITQFMPQYRDQQNANARLIAAAPDLLEAVQAFLQYDSNVDAGGVQMMLDYDTALTKARAAIARARGEQP